MKGRARARQAQCQSNLRQLGHAFHLYMDDWDGTLPSPGGLFGERSYWDQGSDAGLDEYLRNRTGVGSVWVCPELDLSTWDSQWEPRSYSMNTFLRDPPDTEPYTEAIKIIDGLALGAVPAPAATILLFEGTQSIANNASTGRGYVFRNGDWTLERGYWRVPQDDFFLAHRPWHGAVNNTLFVDGHVKARTPDPREPDRPDSTHDLWHVKKDR
jgi:prepilin-type processing-associated H-X9-DG protein